MIEGVLIDYHNTFHLALTPCFWMECAWFSEMFINRFVGNERPVSFNITWRCNNSHLTISFSIAEV